MVTHVIATRQGLYERDLLVHVTTVVQILVILQWCLRSQDIAILLAKLQGCHASCYSCVEPAKFLSIRISN